MNNYSVEQHENFFKIKINELPHLIIDTSSLIGIQSWKPEDGSDKYCIEFTFKTNTILAEYGSIKCWENILKLIDKLI